ncbi:unnamed protein product [Peronospora destructor]|uniref:Sulfatase N-terminal domain-containing protein n=1 Tax=Peronospora destructor TaxID=86335 RepID=A0AAV0U9X5_9STRA|nr:unnamed protein product [Peronospora destructor]
MTALIRMYATAKEATPGVFLGAATLGFAEDFVCATYLVSALWLFDILKRDVGKRFSDRKDSGTVTSIRKFATFAASWLLCITMMIPFSADALLVRSRGMRFTFGLIKMAIDEKDSISAVPVSTDEVNQAFLHGAVLVVVATLFASMRTNCTKRLHDKLETNENVADLSLKSVTPKRKVLQDSAAIEDTVVQVGEPVESMETEKMLDQDNAEGDNISPMSQRMKRELRLKRGITVIISLVVLPAIVVVASSLTSPLIAYSALNTSLNELFGGILLPTLPHTDGALSWPEKFIHTATENYALLGNNSLYRRTTGFHGELAFNVTVAPNNPPNVVLIVIESFRYHDSHYLVGEEDPSNLFKGTNLTITPNFDRWAKRGVALRNLWSSWKTSRSVESLLFAQLPYDSTTKTGTTGGRKTNKLSGLPQLFTAKGYETYFTTGCKTNYDNWDIFLPTHGFDTVLARDEMMMLAMTHLGIKPEDWYGSEHRALNWGVHDDLSFQLLGDLMVDKTKEQKERVADKKPKKPLFLTHYTISSHVDYVQRPRWYAEAEKPDFSALYEGQQYADVIKHYLEIRYFTDMELGKFMDRMAKEGILNDTIVVIVGDHGQAPEFGTDVPENREASVTRVAGSIIAEGRLVGSDALVIDDPTEQYDILNTLADITGVPDGGFIQDGVGRSLKRKVKFGERLVYSNNPNRKMSIVHGHQRFRYDRVTESILLHDAEKDHDMTTDLFPKLTAKEQAEWLSRRDDGRWVNDYYKKRWENECLLTPDCTRT